MFVCKYIYNNPNDVQNAWNNWNHIETFIIGLDIIILNEKRQSYNLYIHLHFQ